MEELTIPIEEDVDLIKIINEDVPKNIILLFIQEYGNNDAIWRDLEKSSIFSVRRNLQVCLRLQFALILINFIYLFCPFIYTIQFYLYY